MIAMSSGTRMPARPSTASAPRAIEIARDEQRVGALAALEDALHRRGAAVGGEVAVLDGALLESRRGHRLRGSPAVGRRRRAS